MSNLGRRKDGPSTESDPTGAHRIVDRCQHRVGNLQFKKPTALSRSLDCNVAKMRIEHLVAFNAQRQPIPRLVQVGKSVSIFECFVEVHAIAYANYMSGLQRKAVLLATEQTLERISSQHASVKCSLKGTTTTTAAPAFVRDTTDR
jgi:hypothetical protein